MNENQNGWTNEQFDDDEDDAIESADVSGYVDELLTNAKVKDSNTGFTNTGFTNTAEAEATCGPDTDTDTDGVDIDVDIDEGYFTDGDDGSDGSVVDPDDVDILPIQSLGIAQDHTRKLYPSKNKVWLKRSYLAPNETDNEFHLFRTYVGCGRGRTINYITVVSQLSHHKINLIAQRNNWIRRVRAYDSYMLEQRLAESQDSRHDEHVRQLEIYRQEQEIIGKQTSYTAGKILELANRTLDNLVTNESQLNVDDLPKFLTVAAKLAETGKVLQSTALGVDQLMQALDETEE